MLYAGLIDSYPLTWTQFTDIEKSESGTSGNCSVTNNRVYRFVALESRNNSDFLALQKFIIQWNQ